MADKTEILRYITSLAEQNLVTRKELNAAYTAGLGAGGDASEASPGHKLNLALSVTQVMYYIGGAIVFLGIAIFVEQNWSGLNFPARLLATLVSGVAAHTVGIVFSRDERTESAAPAFFLISALITPYGIYVLFDNAGIKASGYGYQTIISLILLSTYITSYLVFRKSIFVFFSILFGTWFFYSVTSYLTADGSIFNEEEYYLYRTLIAGVSYIFLGRALAGTRHKVLTGFLTNFGLLAFLAAALILGGPDSGHDLLWEVIYPGIVFGILFLSAVIRSRAYLVWGTIFLMAYILKITGEHFSRGFGWPLALVIAGLSLIGVGYMSVTIKKKYISAA